MRIFVVLFIMGAITLGAIVGMLAALRQPAEQPTVLEIHVLAPSLAPGVNYAYLELCEWTSEKDWQGCMRQNGIDPTPARWELVDTSF